MNNLKEIRTKKGLTQIQLAEQSGISIQNIKKMESKNFSLAKCKYETLIKLSNALGVDIDELLF